MDVCCCKSCDSITMLYRLATNTVICSVAWTKFVFVVNYDRQCGVQTNFLRLQLSRFRFGRCKIKDVGVEQSREPMLGLQTKMETNS